MSLPPLETLRVGDLEATFCNGEINLCVYGQFSVSFTEGDAMKLRDWLNDAINDLRHSQLTED